MATINTSNATGASTTADTEAHLLRVPAEIRNNILSLALIEDDDIPVEKGNWPGVLHTCQQLRKEGLPMYLGNNTFLVTIKDLDGDLFRLGPFPREAGAVVHHVRSFDRSALTGWLHIINGLPKDLIKSVKGVTIHCDGDFMSAELGRQTDGNKRMQLRPSFTFWDALIVDLKAAGFGGQQLTWPRLRATKVTSFNEDTYLLYLLCKHILTPLLAEHGMLDEARSPAGIVDVIVRDKDHLLADVNGREAVMRLEAHEGWPRGPQPSKWFGEWKASPETFF